MQKLTDLKVDEVSFVPKGANKQKFLIRKEEDFLMTIAEILKQEGFDISLQNEPKIDEILKSQLKDEKAIGAVKAAIRILSAHKEMIPAKIMSELGTLAGYGYAEPQKQDDQKKPDDVTKSALPIKKADGTFDFSHIPAESRPVIEAIWKEKEDQDKQNKELRDQVKKEQDLRITKEFVEKVEKELSNLSIDKNELGKVLKSVADISKEDSEKLLKTLKAADEQVKKSALFSEIGSNVPVNKGQDAWAKIEKEAEEISKKDSKISKSEAIDLVIKQKPELYNEYRKEKDA